jgi:hypothetical protein
MVEPRTALVFVCSVALLAVGVWHILQGDTTERLFREVKNVRRVGAGLLVLALPCFVWKGWYFWTLGGLLALSGALRLFAPQWNVRLQERAYPRWVHGWVMVTGGVLTGAVYALYGRI